MFFGRVSSVTPIVLLLDDTNIIWYGNRGWHQYAQINNKQTNKKQKKRVKDDKINRSQDDSNIIFTRKS